MSSSRNVVAEGFGGFSWFKNGCLKGKSLEIKSSSCSKCTLCCSTHSKFESKYIEDVFANDGVSSNSIVCGFNVMNSNSNAADVFSDDMDLPSKGLRKRGTKRGPRGLKELLKTAAIFHEEVFRGENDGIDVSSPHYKRWLRGVNYREKRWNYIKMKYPTGHDASTAESNDIELKTNVEESTEKLPKNLEVCTQNIPSEFEGDLVIISSDDEDV